MILELLLNALLSLAGVIFGSIEVDLSMIDTIYETIFDVLDGVMFFLPSHTIFQILTLFCTLMVFRVGISFFRSLWGVLPFV